MQLLGKQYFENEEHSVTAEVDCAAQALCDALEGPIGKESRIPAWMAAAGNIVRDNGRHIAVAASVLVIGLAVYFNWAMYTENGTHTGVLDTDPSLLTAEVGIPSDAMAGDAVGAGSLSSDDGDYFSVSQINRQRARDEAIAVLQDVVDGAENLSDVQSEALSEIAQIAADIEHEAAIESLVKGKGFTECIAVISGENANVIVQTSALLPNEVAQIQEIVYETAGIVPANVKIIEK